MQPPRCATRVHCTLSHNDQSSCFTYLCFLTHHILLALNTQYSLFNALISSRTYQTAQQAKMTNCHYHLSYSTFAFHFPGKQSLPLYYCSKIPCSAGFNAPAPYWPIVMLYLFVLPHIAFNFRLAIATAKMQPDSSAIGFNGPDYNDIWPGKLSSLSSSETRMWFLIATRFLA